MLSPSRCRKVSGGGSSSSMITDRGEFLEVLRGDGTMMPALQRDPGGLLQTLRGTAQSLCAEVLCGGLTLRCSVAKLMNAADWVMPKMTLRSRPLRDAFPSSALTQDLIDRHQLGKAAKTRERARIEATRIGVLVFLRQRLSPPVQVARVHEVGVEAGEERRRERLLEWGPLLDALLGCLRLVGLEDGFVAGEDAADQAQAGDVAKEARVDDGVAGDGKHGHVMVERERGQDLVQGQHRRPQRDRVWMGLRASLCERSSVANETGRLTRMAAVPNRST